MKIKLFFRVKALLIDKEENSEYTVGQKYLVNYNPEEYIEVYVDAANCKITELGAIWVPLSLFNFNF